VSGLRPTVILRRLRCERGQALVEFALVAPVLLLVLFAVLDFGKAFNYWNDETQLAAEGARLAIVNADPATLSCNGAGVASLQAYIKCQADTSELSKNAIVCISFPNGSSNPGDPVRVTVKTPYQWLPLIGNAVGQVGSFTLSGSATMRLEIPAGTTLHYSPLGGGTGACP
jgi:Flp pilus assembly protein TadG